MKHISWYLNLPHIWLLTNKHNLNTHTIASYVYLWITGIHKEHNFFVEILTHLTSYDYQEFLKYNVEKSIYFFYTWYTCALWIWTSIVWFADNVMHLNIHHGFQHQCCKKLLTMSRTSTSYVFSQYGKESNKYFETKCISLRLIIVYINIHLLEVKGWRVWRLD